jgi:hypothetical protein
VAPRLIGGEDEATLLTTYFDPDVRLAAFAMLEEVEA